MIFWNEKDKTAYLQGLINPSNEGLNMELITSN